MAFEFPPDRPEDETDFFTEPKGFVLGRAIAVQITQDLRGGPLLALALRIEDGQRAKSDADGSEVDVGGREVVTYLSLKGGAYAVTMGSLAACGYSATLAVERLKDAAAVALRQQAAAATAHLGAAEAKKRADEAMGLEALRRGDLASCGLGTYAVRLVVYRKPWTTGSGEERSPLRVQYINPVPRKMEASDVLSIVNGQSAAPARAPASAQQGRRGGAGYAAPPPRGAANGSDEVDF